MLEATHTLRAHVGDVFSEWISRSAHFVVNPIPLEEGWHHTGCGRMVMATHLNRVPVTCSTQPSYD